MNWIEVLANVENIFCKVFTGIVISRMIARWLDERH